MLLWVVTGWAWHDSLVSLLLVLVLLAVLGGIAVVAAGRGDSLEQEAPDRAPYGALADGDIERDDVDRLRFSLAFRGYRMDEVDNVLDRLAGELVARDARIAELEGHGRADRDGSPGHAHPDGDAAPEDEDLDEDLDPPHPDREQTHGPQRDHEHAPAHHDGRDDA